MKIIECPRDAMQGLVDFIPTSIKVNYVNQLLKIGFDTIDVGSFVSPKAIPQMKDTAEVLNQLDFGNSKSKLLTIVANKRGAEEAIQFDAVSFLGFPLSISETFQQRNTNKSIDEALELVGEIQDLCSRTSKRQVVYISMGFGNPYNDPYDVGIVEEFTHRLFKLGVETISLADTIGVAHPEQISYLFKTLTQRFPSLEIGAHLHSNPMTSLKKIDAAYNAGCKRFDGALRGYGGCPMANDKLVGNMATETIISYLKDKQVEVGLDLDELENALTVAGQIFHT